MYTVLYHLLCFLCAVFRVDAETIRRQKSEYRVITPGVFGH